MKGIILAGGSGSRLQPCTKVTNKHLLPVYNKPMICYPLKTLITGGITDIMIVLGRIHCGHFLEFLGFGQELNINLTYAVQEEAGGIAQALSLCKNFANKDSVAVNLGDNIFEDIFNFSTFREGARVYLKAVLDPERFGVAKFDMKTIKLNNIQGREEWLLKEIVEKPKEFVSNYAVTGLYLYDNNVFDIIKKLKPSERGELEITDVNNAYIKEGKMEYEIVTDFWSDAGTFDSLYKASEFVRNKKE